MKKGKIRNIVGVLVVVCSALILFVGNDRTSDAKETDQKAAFTLTKEEKSYLKSIHGDKITLGVTEKYEYTVNKQEEEVGACIPILKFMEEELNLDVEVIQSDWNTMYQNLQDEKIDMLYNVSINEETSKQIYLASPMESTSLMLVSCEINDNIKNTENIHVGFVKNSQAEYYGLPLLNLTKKISYYNGTSELLLALKNHEIDAAMILDDCKSYVYEQEELSIVRTFPLIKINNTIGTCNKKFSPLIQIIDRYIENSSHGQELIQQIEKEKERYDKSIFCHLEQKAIAAVKKQYNKVLYYGGSGIELPFSYVEEGVKKGVIPDMFSFFEATTGIDFVEDTNVTQGEDVEDALFSNDIQLAAGISQNSESMEEYNFSDDVYQSNYIAISKINEKEITDLEIKNYYWGIIDSDVSLFNHTLFEEQLITFLSDREMIEGLTNNQVKGILVNQGVLDYYNIILGSKQYKNYLNVSVPTLERIAYNKKNDELNMLIDKLLRLYKINYPDYNEDINNMKLAYQDQSTHSYSSLVRQQVGILILSVLFLLILISVAVGFICFNRTNSKMDTKLKMLLRTNKNLDIIEVNKSTGIIHSSSGFEKYKSKFNRIQQKEMTLERLSELSGYNFIDHYNKIYELKQDLFEIEYSIFIDGKRYHRKEIGNKHKGYIISTIIDLTDAEDEQEIIQQKFDYDPLTGLFNECSYIEKICAVVESNPETLGAFAFINLDHFKSVNESLGHMAGDEILKAFGESISRLVKNENTVVFRLSGDGFGAFRGNLENDLQLQEFFDELHNLSAATQFEGKYIERSYRCGVSLYNRHAVEIQKLIDCADEAMYQCKLGNQKVVIWNEQKENE